MTTVRLGSTTYPVVLPKITDPRLHLAFVIITVHILGQTVLGFRVSVPQILSAILTCALIEVGWVFATRQQIAWPASAMLTGSGVALILRLVGAERDDHWTWRGWYLFALVAGASLLSKYAIRVRDSHLFNPSNFGLVLAFLIFGSSVIEPLDFWWAPLNPGMAAAYLVILIGGLLITARLKLLSMAGTFWLSLGTGLAVLSISGHCITAAWSLQPLCGLDFWQVVMTSPELLIFLFFMITDPKTIPSGRASRIVFSTFLGIVCTLLMAPQRTEFGAKVGLLAGLVLLTPLRFVFDRFLARERRWPSSVRFAFVGGTALGATAIVLAGGIVAAGAPAREVPIANLTASPSLAVEVDSSSLPTVRVSPEVEALNSDAASDPSLLAVQLAEALQVENEAMLAADTSMLRTVSEGERLLTMERNIEAAAARGRFVVNEYIFDALLLEVVYSNGPQGGASLALEASGSRTEIEYDATGAELNRTLRPFSSVFLLSPGNGDRWLIAAEVDPASLD